MSCNYLLKRQEYANLFVSTVDLYSYVMLQASQVLTSLITQYVSNMFVDKNFKGNWSFQSTKLNKIFGRFTSVPCHKTAAAPLITTHLHIFFF